MIGDSQEIEVKFYLTDPEGFIVRLEAAGAKLKCDRAHETDLRFDNTAGDLLVTGQVLRLRKDNEVTLTYKAAGDVSTGTTARREIEVTVSDFDIARELLEGIGYHPYMMYEKYRTTYTFNQCEVVLDEMPYGWFCEIEGQSPLAIQETAGLLDLNWNSRILDSYTFLFTRCRDALGLTFTDLSFSHFKDVSVTPRDLGVSPGDFQEKSG
jgi:adenylate cyclase, class 2